MILEEVRQNTELEETELEDIRKSRHWTHQWSYLINHGSKDVQHKLFSKLSSHASLSSSSSLSSFFLEEAHKGWTPCFVVIRKCWSVRMEGLMLLGSWLFELITAWFNDWEAGVWQGWESQLDKEWHHWNLQCLLFQWLDGWVDLTGSGWWATSRQGLINDYKCYGSG